MPRRGSIPFSFPGFRGAARLLVLINLASFFVLLLAGLVWSRPVAGLIDQLLFYPDAFLHGSLWQPFTYSLVHAGITGTLLELLSIWFLASFLEQFHGANWVNSLFVVSVVGAALASALIYLVSGGLNSTAAVPPLYGCLGGIFGMLAVIGVLYGEVEFLMFFVIGIKARYMAIIYALVAIAMLFGAQRWYALAQLGGAAAALAYIRLAPRRGVSFAFSESWYGLRNRFYRWKRRKAAKKFEVYMRKQGRTVRFDGQGRQIDPDRTQQDHDDKKRWN